MHLSLGGDVSLRPWRTEDAPALAKAANNRNVWISLRDRMPHPYTLADAEDYIRHRLEVDSELMFCIEADGCAVRGIGLHPQKDVCRITPSSATGWRKRTGQGITTEAVRAMVRHGFDTRPLERIGVRSRPGEGRLHIRRPPATECNQRRASARLVTLLASS